MKKNILFFVIAVSGFLAIQHQLSTESSPQSLFLTEFEALADKTPSDLL